MKTCELGDILYWKGELHKVIGRIDLPAVILENIERKCPECGRIQSTIIEQSPLFQENAEPVKTIK